MKNLTLLFTILFLGWSVNAAVHPKSSLSAFNNSFIFIEGGVEFAVYPNGEFDFYFNPDFRRSNSVHISSPNVNISYNSGYNYDPYVQYDDYGAVIQIEHVPLYYDHYGRLIQAGDVFIGYNNYGRISRIGNMRLHYDRHHHFSHHSGFINHFNRHYVYRPWHRYYMRPNINVSIVFNRPYRAYYEPYRMNYAKYVTVYNNHYYGNGSNNFYRPADKVRSYNYGRRTTSKRAVGYTRTNDGLARSRQQTARSKAYSDRGRYGKSNRDSESKTSKTMRRYGRSEGDISISKRNSGRMERSSNSRGRSTINKRNTENSKRVTRNVAPRHESALRKNHDTDIHRNTSNRRTARPKRILDKPERNTEIKRQTSRRINADRTSGSRRSKSREINNNNSSRKRSSARNMN